MGSRREHGRSWKSTGTFLGQEGERRQSEEETLVSQPRSTTDKEIIALLTG